MGQGVAKHKESESEVFLLTLTPPVAFFFFGFAAFGVPVKQEM